MTKLPWEPSEWIDTRETKVEDGITYIRQIQYYFGITGLCYKYRWAEEQEEVKKDD